MAGAAATQAQGLLKRFKFSRKAIANLSLNSQNIEYIPFRLFNSYHQASKQGLSSSCRLKRDGKFKNVFL